MSKTPIGAETLGQAVMRALHDELRNLHVTWKETPEDQQAGVIDRLRAAVQLAIVKGMREALAMGWPSVTANLAKATITEDGVNLILKFLPESLHEITDFVGSDVVLVLVNPISFAEGLDIWQADLDQPDLELEHPEADEVPAEMQP